MEITIRSTHYYFITRLATENIRRSDTGRHFLESGLRFRLKRRSGYSDCQHYSVSLCRIVCHRISTNSIGVILRFDREDIKPFPHRKIGFSNVFLVKIFVVINSSICRNLYLSIRTGNEIHVFTLRKSNDKLFHEWADILIAYHRTLPFFNAKHAFGNLNL